MATGVLIEGGVAVVLVAAVLLASLVVVAVRVDGGSMEPTLQGGDLVLVRRGAVPRVGDVALFRLPGDSKPTLHRIVSRSTSGMLTRGDANRVDDLRPVADDDVMGAAMCVIPAGKWARDVRDGL